MSRGPRSSRSQIRKRVADIYGLVVDGVPHAQIFRFVAANCSWQASERTIESYIARAREQMREDAQVERREVFAESLARKQRLFARASMRIPLTLDTDSAASRSLIPGRRSASERSDAGFVLS